MVLRRTVLAAALWVLVLHVLLQELRVPILVLGPLDWSAHLATAIILLANLPVRPPRAFTVAALVTVMAIDLDHVPGYLGTDVLAQDTPRPYPHALVTALVAAAIGAALSGRARAIAFGAAFGVLAHLARDVATGNGVALLWPLSTAGVQIPFWVESAAIAALATRAWQRTRTPSRRHPDDTRRVGRAAVR